MKFIGHLTKHRRFSIEQKRVEIMAVDFKTAYDSVETLYPGWGISCFWSDWK